MSAAAGTGDRTGREADAVQPGYTTRSASCLASMCSVFEDVGAPEDTPRRLSAEVSTLMGTPVVERLDMRSSFTMHDVHSYGRWMGNRHPTQSPALPTVGMGVRERLAGGRGSATTFSLPYCHNPSGEEPRFCQESVPDRVQGDHATQTLQPPLRHNALEERFSLIDLLSIFRYRNETGGAADVAAASVNQPRPLFP